MKKLGKLVSCMLMSSLVTVPVIAQEEASLQETITQEVTMTTAMGEGSSSVHPRDEMTFIREHGEYINQSVVQDNLKLTVEYILLDQYSPQLLVSVEKLDGETFKEGSEIRFSSPELITQEKIDTTIKEAEQQAKITAALAELPEDAEFVDRLKVLSQFNEVFSQFITEDDTADMEAFNAYITQVAYVSGYETSTSGWHQCQTDENTESKIYYIYQANDSAGYSNNMRFRVDTIGEAADVSYDFSIDLAKVLEDQEGMALQTVPNTPSESDLNYLETLQEDDEEYQWYKEELERQPKALLTEQGLALEIVEGIEDEVVERIGFVNNQLHIGTVRDGDNRYSLECYDENGEWIEITYSVQSSRTLEDGTRTSEAYYIFDIASIEELKNYTFKLEGTEIIASWDDAWDIPVTTQPLPETQLIQMNKPVNYTDSDKAYITELQLGRTTVGLNVEEIDQEVGYGNITLAVGYKDGMERSLRRIGITKYSEGQLTLVYQLDDYMTEDIAWIKMGEDVIYSAE